MLLAFSRFSTLGYFMKNCPISIKRLTILIITRNRVSNIYLLETTKFFVKEIAFERYSAVSEVHINKTLFKVFLKVKIKNYKGI
jgi:hypothetical protein